MGLFPFHFTAQIHETIPETRGDLVHQLRRRYGQLPEAKKGQKHPSADHPPIRPGVHYSAGQFSFCLSFNHEPVRKAHTVRARRLRHTAGALENRYFTLTFITYTAGFQGIGAKGAHYRDKMRHIGHFPGKFLNSARKRHSLKAGNAFQAATPNQSEKAFHAGSGFREAGDDKLRIINAQGEPKGGYGFIYGIVL